MKYTILIYVLEVTLLGKLKDNRKNNKKKILLV